MGNEKIGGTGYCVTYDTDSQSRNADFISIARRAIRHPQCRRRCRPLSEANTTFLYNLRRSRAPLFFKIAAKPPPQPSARRAVKLKNPWAEGPSILRTFPFTTLLHNPPPSGGHNPRAVGPSTFPSEPSEPSEPFEPSRRRRVQSCVPWRSSCHNLRIILKPPLGRLFFIYTGQS